MCQVVQSLVSCVRYQGLTVTFFLLISLLFKVECDPICKIIWLKDEDIINAGDDEYEVEEYTIEEDVNANQFKSVSSKLIWNLEYFSDLRLNNQDLNFTISCGVGDSDIGVAIFSKTEVTIECTVMSHVGILKNI